ncbi:MAG: nicotinate (nicotinamide) nucleotide adenylyltransferase [Spirochaetaceae bacterium]|nr:MAG: nicotinate (nicotinamide) nucleotide adenylyltransferase [Spirochaetaceae bacterium]
MKIAMLGGTFDPIHIGHLMIADEVRARLGYDRIVFVPAYSPPHKSGAPLATADQRIGMIEASLRGRPEFELERFEVDQRGVSFTVETLRHLARCGRGADRPGLIIGQDLVGGFETWREVDAIVEMSDLIVVGRPGESGTGLVRPHRTIDNPLLDISSTEIRRRVAESLPYRYLVHPGVFDFIARERLYRGCGG